jgi:hypothetical protein
MPCSFVARFMSNLLHSSYSHRDLFSSNDINTVYRSSTGAGIATGYRLQDRELIVRVPVVKYIPFSTSSRQALGTTQPPIQWVPEPLSPGVKWPVHETDHSPPASAEVKNTWVNISTPPYVFMAQCFVFTNHQHCEWKNVWLRYRWQDFHVGLDSRP